MTRDISVAVAEMVADDLVFFARTDMPVDIDAMVIAIGHECGVPKTQRERLRQIISQSIEMMMADEAVAARLEDLRARHRTKRQRSMH